jgi:polysaccharide export outer membrane protein
MKKTITSKPGILFSLLGIILLFSACSDTKHLTYFTDMQDKTIQTKTSNVEPVIQVSDLLSITVSSLNPEATAIFNAPNESTPNANVATAGNNTLTIGYLVNPNGDIQFPVLGKIHVEGLNKSQLNALLVKELTDKKLLVDPIITIRHLNFRVSVLGEVSKPGVFTVQNEKLSLLEALSLAGDITIYGKKDNIMVIRENDKGEKIVKRLNLNTQEIFASPYYYLKSNDIVYVEPSKDRVAKERNLMLFPVIMSTLTFLIIVSDQINW